MKQINLQEKVASQGGTGMERIKEVGSQLYIPSYKGVNNVLYKAGGDGTIAFNDALAANGRKELDKYIQVNTALKGSDALIDIDNEMNKASEEHIKQNPDGEGYTLAMTTKYKSLVDDYSSNADTDDIRNFILINSKNGLRDWGNKSFRTESIRKASFYEAGIRQNKDVLRNKIMTSPELYESLTPAYISQVDAMKDDPHVDFAKYRKESLDEWDVSYVQGLIKKNPNQTLELLKNGNLVANLDPDKRNQLINASTQQIEHNEYRAYIAQKNAEHALDRVRKQNNSRLDLMRIEGNLSQNDLKTMYDNGEIDEECYNRQAYKIIKDKNSKLKKIDNIDKIIKSQQDKTPTFGVTNDEKTKFLLEKYKMDEEADGEYPSLMMRLDYVAENQVTFNYEMPHFKNEIESKIIASSDPKQIMDGALSLSGYKNIKALKGIDPLLIDFSEIAIDALKSSNNNIDSLIKLRDEWFKKDESSVKDRDIQEFRKKEWKQTEYAKEDEKFNALDRLYESNDIGYSMDIMSLKFFVDRIPKGQQEIINAKVLKKLEKVYMQTGSLSKAEIATSAYIKNMFQKTDINGEDELMYNAPTYDKVGVEEYAIKNIIRAVSSDIVDHLSKNKIPISRKSEFLKAKKVNNDWDYGSLLKDPYASSKEMKINVVIDGKQSSRKLYYESVDYADKNIGHLFYYFDEENKRGKEYLLKPSNTNKFERYVVDIDSIIKHIKK